MVNKRRIVCSLVLAAIAVAGAIAVSIKAGKEEALPTASGELIRFHVIANSDNIYDQALKLKVRDEVIKTMSPLLGPAGSINDARKKVDENLELVSSVSEQVIQKNGYNYPVKVMHGTFEFPEKTYRIKAGNQGGESELTLPAGEYEAVRVVIGEGKGANWWCVLFPPLCFVDPVAGSDSRKANPIDIPENMEKKTSEDIPAFKYNRIDPGVASAEPAVEYRLKVVEWYRQLKDKV